MRSILVLLLFGLLSAGTALAETVTISAAWTQVRRNPAANSRAIDIVYGNDTFTVLETKDGWAKITTARKATGWVPMDPAAQQPPRGKPAHAEPAGEKPVGEKPSDAKPLPAAPAAPSNLRATALSNAVSLRKLGYQEQAREKFTDLILSYPGTPEAYEATRQMLSFYLVGYLPPLAGSKVTPEGQGFYPKVSADVLLQEAIALQGENKTVAAARVYQALVDQDPNNGRAFLGLLDTLQRSMADSVKNQKQQDLAAQVATFKKYFPNLPLPDGVKS
jgi:hypothetical protein